MKLNTKFSSATACFFIKNLQKKTPRSLIMAHMICQLSSFTSSQAIAASNSFPEASYWAISGGGAASGGGVASGGAASGGYASSGGGAASGGYASSGGGAASGGYASSGAAAARWDQQATKASVEDPSNYAIYGGPTANVVFQHYSEQMPTFLAHNIRFGQPLSKLLEDAASIREKIAVESKTPHPENFKIQRLSNMDGVKAGSLTPVLKYPLMRKIIMQNISSLPQSKDFIQLDDMFDYRFRIATVGEWIRIIKEEHTDSNQFGAPLIRMIEGENGSGDPSTWLFDYETGWHEGALRYDRHYTEMLKDAFSKAKLGIIVDTIKLGYIEIRFKSTDVKTRGVLFPLDSQSLPDYSNVPFALIHPNTCYMDFHRSQIEHAFENARHSIGAESEKIKQIDEFSYLFALSMPFVRGSAAINEWLSSALYLHHGLMSPKRKLDEIAQASLSLDQFRKTLLTQDIGVNPFVKTEIEYFAEGDVFNISDLQINPMARSLTPLCELMEKSGSDKNSVRHTYSQLYHRLLEKKRDTAVNVLEFGIGSCNPQFAFTMGPRGTVGASLRAYKQYFNGAHIYGADIDKEALFNEDRISCHYVDALKAETINTLFETIGTSVNFDFIVDDGFHDFSANSLCLLNSLSHLKDDGIYVVEDVRTDQIPLFRELIMAKLATDYDVAIVRLPAANNVYDNNVIIVKKKQSGGIRRVFLHEYPDSKAYVSEKLNPEFRDLPLVKLLQDKFSTSLSSDIDRSQSIYNIEGMSGFRFRHLLNSLVNKLSRSEDGANYLEIGVWKGSTFCSAISGNRVNATAIDNWEQFGGPSGEFHENLKRTASDSSSEIKFYDHDFNTFDYSLIGKKANLYFFDGPHTFQDQRAALELPKSCLSDTFIFLVDDYNWEPVRSGTLAGISNYEILYSVELRTTLDESHGHPSRQNSHWHNGVGAFVLKKRSE